MFENPFATNDYIFDTSPSIKNDDMFANKHTLEDNYSIAYNNTMPLIFDNYKEYYDMGYNYNYPLETCHNHRGLTQTNPFNVQFVYHVQVLYDDPTPLVINEKHFYYEGDNDTFMHMVKGFRCRKQYFF